MPVFEGRGEKTRTSDLHVPNVARCQLCYTPKGSCWILERTKVSIFFNMKRQNPLIRGDLQDLFHVVTRFLLFQGRNSAGSMGISPE